MSAKLNTCGALYLLPTPLYAEADLDSRVLKVIQDALSADLANQSVFVFEEAKVARRRWLSWGLPREWIEKFMLYNEHQGAELHQELLRKLKEGKNIYLMSDGGLPGFCDPGVELVDLCHVHKIQIKHVGVDNSVMLAMILSGYPSTPSAIYGFLPRDPSERQKALQKIKTKSELVVVMDTPYRLKAVLEAALEVLPEREIFLAMDIDSPQEELFRGTVKMALDSFGQRKSEFVLIFSPLHRKK